MSDETIKKMLATIIVIMPFFLLICGTYFINEKYLKVANNNWLLLPIIFVLLDYFFFMFRIIGHEWFGEQKDKDQRKHYDPNIRIWGLGIILGFANLLSNILLPYQNGPMSNNALTNILLLPLQQPNWQPNWKIIMLKLGVIFSLIGLLALLIANVVRIVKED